MTATFHEPNMRYLRDTLRHVLETGGEQTFSMRDWLRTGDGWGRSTIRLDELRQLTPTAEKGWSCGTAACMAGWTVLSMPEEVTKAGWNTVTIRGVARDILGLSDEEADRLFYGRWSGKPLERITLKDAVSYLDDCLDAGRLLSRREVEARRRGA